MNDNIEIRFYAFAAAQVQETINALKNRAGYLGFLVKHSVNMDIVVEDVSVDGGLDTFKVIFTLSKSDATLYRLKYNIFDHNKWQIMASYV
jgi:hypothetical protein